MTMISPSEEFAKDLVRIAENRKIPFIKIVRAATQMGLKDAKELVETILLAAELEATRSKRIDDVAATLNAMTVGELLEVRRLLAEGTNSPRRVINPLIDDKGAETAEQIRQRAQLAASLDPPRD